MENYRNEYAEAVGEVVYVDVTGLSRQVTSTDAPRRDEIPDYCDRASKAQVKYVQDLMYRNYYRTQEEQEELWASVTGYKPWRNNLKQRYYDKRDASKVIDALKR